MNKEIVIALVILLLIIMVGLYALSGKKCLVAHHETKYMPGYSTFIYTGKVMVPIYHPGHYYNAEVCDKWEGSK